MKINKKIKTELILIISMFILVLIFSFYVNNQEIDLDKVCINDVCFEVEIVSTPEEKAKGLMFREKLEENEGVLFTWEEEGTYSFWMKNTLIPLDIIWIDEGLKIVYVLENIPPCESDPCQVYTPGNKAKYVLEINAGISEEKLIDIGKKVSFVYS